MTKSELIGCLAAQFPHQKQRTVEMAVRLILGKMELGLVSGGRIEIRGFGSFCLHDRAPRTGRNPKTGELVKLEEKRVPHFKPGKALRERVNIYSKSL